MKHDYPILEHDPVRVAVLEPTRKPDAPDLPERAVACFFHEVVEDVASSGEARLVHNLHSGMGNHPIYEMSFNGKQIAVFQPGIGAPL